jgi:hypothetical protein
LRVGCGKGGILKMLCLTVLGMDSIIALGESAPTLVHGKNPYIYIWVLLVHPCIKSLAKMCTPFSPVLPVLWILINQPRPVLVCTIWPNQSGYWTISAFQIGHSEPAPTSAPWRMDDKWWGNSFLSSSSSLANSEGWLSCFF